MNSPLLNPTIFSNTCSTPQPNSQQPIPSRPPSSLALAKRLHPGELANAAEKGISKTTARTIPAFLTKLFTMVNDPATDHLIKWNQPSGDSFFVVSSERFGRELLPKYFKHSNFGSFVRQLNMYGFHKVPHLNQGVLQGEVPETEMLEFSSPNFQRGQPDLLCLIQRKKSCPDSANPTTQADVADPSSASAPSTSLSNTDLQTILADIGSIRKHQGLISSDLKNLQSSNAHLWQEALAARERNKRCQDTINKILGFLAQVFGGRIASVNNNQSRGNAGSRSARKDVELDEAADDDAGVNVLMAEGASIPPRDTRARPAETRDHQDDIRFPSPSGSPLPMFPNARLPRLMLEDSQRAASHSSIPSNSVSSTATPSDMGVGLSDIVYDTESREMDDEVVSPQTPSARRSQSEANTAINSDPGRFSRLHDSSGEQSIDPNLDTRTSDAPQTDPGSLNVPDLSSPDAVLQALFSDQLSSGGLNLNEGLLSGINWAEILNGNGSSSFEEPSSSGHGQPTLTSPSPLRITNGRNALEGSLHPSSAQPQHQPCLLASPGPGEGALVHLEEQTDEIAGAAGKVESLEAAIERLVGSLPGALHDLPLETGVGSSVAGGTEEDQLVGQRNGDLVGGSECGGSHQPGFDADAFIRNFISPQSVGGSMGTPHQVQSTEMNVGVGRQAQVVACHGNGVQEDVHSEAVDLDRILDEWTGEEASRRDASASRASTGVYQPERGRISVPGVTGAGREDGDRAPGRVAFDLNDDEHLRRIMCKKNVAPPPTQQLVEGGGAAGGQLCLGVGLGLKPAHQAQQPVQGVKKRVLDDQQAQVGDGGGKNVGASGHQNGHHYHHASDPNNHLINGKRTKI